MSIEDLRTYGTRAVSDPDVRKKVKEIGMQNLPGHVEFAKTLGLEFSVDDFATLAREAQGELSEDQMSQVAGGWGHVSDGVTVTGVVGGVVSSATSAGSAVASVVGGGGGGGGGW